MNTLISNAIARIGRFVKSIQLKQAIVVALAGFFLLTSTACSGASATTPGSSYDARSSSSNTASPYDKDTGPQRELYKATQRPQGGINNYNDDPKYDNDATKANAKRLIDRAQSNLQKGAQSPQDIIENVRDNNPLGNKASELSRNLGNTVNDIKEDLSAGTQQGTRNLKANVERAKDTVPRVVEGAKQNALSADRDAKQGARDLSQGFQRAADRAADAIQ